MEQDVVWTLAAFGVLAVTIIAVKILVHTKAQQLEESRKANAADESSQIEPDPKVDS